MNGAALATLPCAHLDRPFTTLRVRIPAQVLARAPQTTITFRSMDPAKGAFDPCLAIQTLELDPAS